VLLDYLDILLLLDSAQPPQRQEGEPWVDDIKSRKGLWFLAAIEGLPYDLMEVLFLSRQKNINDSNGLRLSTHAKERANPSEPEEPAHRRAITRTRLRTDRS
jgi:hypothetical protein